MFLSHVGFFEESKRLLYFVSEMYTEDKNGCRQRGNKWQTRVLASSVLCLSKT